MKKLSILVFLALLMAVVVINVFAQNSSGKPEKKQNGSAAVTVQGYGGDVTVTVTVRRGKISNVAVAGNDETRGIGSLAIDTMPALMIKNNSVKVDAVSGATITSRAILAAAQEALSQIPSQ